jgi:hypothetical protein
MHPFSITTGGNQISAFEIGQVPRDLGIVCAERVRKKANTHFAVAHEVQEPETRTISKSREKELGVKNISLCHNKDIVA